ncbi:MAG: hypothetical protein A3H93_15105 [Rhodocyclales bacterium RIFCSPLOWO2_02_FULL_63_24]|nr:MAG: hypothetical protein A3H93_15105 [Rhodocyclales bacterium RIFCSPLOWO2_02_FULL_63_24]
MLTRCPACETHFRVTPEQLKARSGRVRCGECQHVFNALDSLIEEPLVIVAPRTPEAPPQALAQPLAETGATADANPDTGANHVAAPPAPTLEPMPEPTGEVLQELTSVLPETLDELPSEPPDATATEPSAPMVATGDDDAAQWDPSFPAPTSPPRRWPWAIGSMLALAAIGLQALLAFRVELAVLWPEVKPALVTLCEMADCEVGLPAKVGLVGIEASDLHPDGEHPGRLALTATLKNRAPFSQRFPHLELTLTDTADKAIARKVLGPADYLPPKTAFAQGMLSNADIAVAVGIDPGELAASGYRLYLFYP